MKRKGVDDADDAFRGTPASGPWASLIPEKDMHQALCTRSATQVFLAAVSPFAQFGYRVLVANSLTQGSLRAGQGLEDAPRGRS
jgi:hypothetical protein